MSLVHPRGLGEVAAPAHRRRPRAQPLTQTLPQPLLVLNHWTRTVALTLAVVLLNEGRGGGHASQSCKVAAAGAATHTAGARVRQAAYRADRSAGSVEREHCGRRRGGEGVLGGRGAVRQRAAAAYWRNASAGGQVGLVLSFLLLQQTVQLLHERCRHLSERAAVPTTATGVLKSAM